MIARPVAFPLFAIVDGKCACGLDSCSRVGKHPAVNWGEVEYGSEVPRPAPGAGVGLKTGAYPKGSGMFIVDIDGEEALERWIELDQGRSPDDTWTVETGRGVQIGFEHPGFHVKNSAGDLAKGIDIRGDGGFVVAPGSPHRSGKTYTLVVDAPPAPAPAWLLEWLRARPAVTEAQSYPGDVTDGTERARRRELYAEYLRTDAPARGPERRGQGDQILFNVVQRGAYDLALPVDDVLELVREHYDPRCSPMWGDDLEERVHHKAHDAKTNSTRPRFEPLPADLAHLTSGAPADDMPTFAPPAHERPTEDRPGDTEPAPAARPAGALGERWGMWSEPLLPPVYLLEGLIPQGKVVTFFAEGGSLKTWSALDVAIAVASGKPWLGRFPVKQGKALYLDYEDGPYEVARRVKMLTHGADVPELGYLYGGPQIDDVELWKTLAKMVLADGITLVVVDSLGAGMPGDADENTTAFAAGMKIAGRFTETGCTVLFVHHANKTGGMRGTSAARDQSDVVFKFEPISETDDTKRMRMVCDKPGPQKRPAPVNVELTDSGLTTFEDEAQTAGRNAKTVEAVEAAIKLALANRSMTGAEIEMAIRGDNKKVRDALRLLKSRGEVRYVGYHEGYVLDDDDRRRERVLAATPDSSSSAAALANAADVPTDFVTAMLRRGEIQERVKGRSMGFIIPLQ